MSVSPSPGQRADSKETVPAWAVRLELKCCLAFPSPHARTPVPSGVRCSFSICLSRTPYCYEVSLNGQRFLFSEPLGESSELAIHIAQNWYEEFRDREQD